MFLHFWVSTNFMHQRVKSRFSVEVFLSHSAENFRRRPLYFVISFGYRKTLRIRERVITFFCENSLSHTGEKIRRGTFLCCVPENF